MAALLLELVGLVLCVGLLGLAVWRYVRTSLGDSVTLHRIDHGLCRACGYSLRGSTGKCAECGRSFRPHEKIPIRHDA